VVVSAIALTLPPPEAFAQPKLVPVAQAEVTEFSTAQLDALLASIALYPDELLTQILMASTFPLQVVGAARWLDKDENKRLKGDALVTALVKENWDPSVKSLIPFPQVVATLNEYLEWTQQLGYAVANQRAAVLDAIQRLRRRRKGRSLKTTGQQKVIEQQKPSLSSRPARRRSMCRSISRRTFTASGPMPKTARLSAAAGSLLPGRLCPRLCLGRRSPCSRRSRRRGYGDGRGGMGLRQRFGQPAALQQHQRQPRPDLVG
jgi:hypothetical protein